MDPWTHAKREPQWARMTNTIHCSCGICVVSPKAPIGWAVFFSRRNGWLWPLRCTCSNTQRYTKLWDQLILQSLLPYPHQTCGTILAMRNEQSSKIFIPLDSPGLPWKTQLLPNLRWVPSPPWWRHWEQRRSGKIQHEHDLPWGYNHPISFLKQDSSLESSCWVVMQHDPFSQGEKPRIFGQVHGNGIFVFF